MMGEIRLASFCRLLLLLDLVSSNGSQTSYLIKKHIEIASSYGLTIPWMNLALTKLSETKELQRSYDRFSRDMKPLLREQKTKDSTLTSILRYFHLLSSDETCTSHPSELLSTYYLTISKKDFNNFLNEDFVQELPEKVQNQLKVLKKSPKEFTVASSFSTILTIDNREAFEVGHMLFKSSFDGTNYRILLLVPSVKTILSEGCYFDDNFREEFSIHSPDLQNYLAIKASINTGFISTLMAFDGPVSDSLFSGRGFGQIATEVGIVFQRSIPWEWEAKNLKENSL
jgi:hypothetical protein